MKGSSGVDGEAATFFTAAFLAVAFFAAVLVAAFFAARLRAGALSPPVPAGVCGTVSSLVLLLIRNRLMEKGRLKRLRTRVDRGFHRPLRNW